MNPKISIIIPIYNAAKTIRSTLESISRQTLTNYEVVLINDGSKDNSKSICENYIKQDSRFKYFEQSNGGVSSARNNGIGKSTGDYLLFVDADDMLPPKSIELLINEQIRYKDYLVCGSYLMKKTRNRELLCLLDDNISEKSIPQDFLQMLNTIPTAPWGKLFERKVVIEKQIQFPVGIPFGEDAIFLYDYLQNVQGIVTFGQNVYEYSYLDANSAGRKYYKEYCVYMRKQYIAKMKLFKQLGIENTDDEFVFFRRSLEHYIVNERNKKLLEKYIKLSIQQFPNSIQDNEYGTYIMQEDITGMIHRWKRSNFWHYHIERLKRR